MEKYTEVTGRVPMMPELRWGFNSNPKLRYKNQEKNFLKLQGNINVGDFFSYLDYNVESLLPKIVDNAGRMAI